MAQIGPLRKGDSVRVKAGVMCPDYERLSLAGWQGRVFEIQQEDDGRTTIGIQWDSITLAELPGDFLADCGEQGCEGIEMYLDADDVERAEARDTEKEACARAEAVRMKCFWLGAGAQGKRILDVIDGIDPDDEEALFTAWEAYMRKVLTLPFAATVCEPQERGPLDEGDEVQVLSSAGIDDPMGVLVKVRRGSRDYSFPLCDLEVVSRKSPAHRPVEDYRFWFANR